MQFLHGGQKQQLRRLHAVTITQRSKLQYSYIQGTKFAESTAAKEPPAASKKKAYKRGGGLFIARALSHLSRPDKRIAELEKRERETEKAKERKENLFLARFSMKVSAQSSSK